MKSIPTRAKLLIPIVIVLSLVTAQVAQALANGCIGCQVAPSTIVAPRNHVPAQSLLYWQTPALKPPAPSKPVYRPPTKLPSIAAPVAAPVAHVAPAAPGSVRARVLAAWPGDDHWVDLTVQCESGFDPMQIGGGGNNYFGLFQFGPWARAHYGNPLTMSVEQQTAAAWRLIKDAGSGQWECSPYRYNP